MQAYFDRPLSLYEYADPELDNVSLGSSSSFFFFYRLLFIVGGGAGCI